MISKPLRLTRSVALDDTPGRASVRIHPGIASESVSGFTLETMSISIHPDRRPDSDAIGRLWRDTFGGAPLAGPCPEQDIPIP
jgi:hypothetical protein